MFQVCSGEGDADSTTDQSTENSRAYRSTVEVDMPTHGRWRLTSSIMAECRTPPAVCVGAAGALSRLK